MISVWFQETTTGGQEVTQGLSIEQGALLISLFLTSWAVYFAWRSSRSGREAVRVAESSNTLSEEQLRLAREEAARRPVLEVARMHLTFWPQSRKLRKLHGRGYEGTFPDAILVIQLRNKGRAVASNVHGKIWIDAGYGIHPIEIPDFETEYRIGGGEGVYDVDLLGPQGRRIVPDPPRPVISGPVSGPPPSPIPGAATSYGLPVRVTKEGTARIRYSFTTEQGDSVDGTQSIKVQPEFVDGYKRTPTNFRE